MCCSKVITLIFFVLLFSCNKSADQSKNEVIAGKVVPSSNQFHPISKTNSNLLNGQTVYVPVYSSIPNRSENNLVHLTVILSIRNISPKMDLIISQVDYYDTNGMLIKKYIDGPFSLSRMATKDFVIPEDDLAGGTGANFVVKWESEQPISIPIIETVMIGEVGTKGFSFTSRGKEIEGH